MSKSFLPSKILFLPFFYIDFSFLQYFRLFCIMVLDQLQLILLKTVTWKYFVCEMWQALEQTMEKHIK